MTLDLHNLGKRGKNNNIHPQQITICAYSPVSLYPSWLHTTWASRPSHRSSHTVPQRPWIHTSTRPWYSVGPPLRVTCPLVQFASASSVHSSCEVYDIIMTSLRQHNTCLQWSSTMHPLMYWAINPPNVYMGSQYIHVYTKIPWTVNDHAWVQSYVRSWRIHQDVM